MSYDSDTNSSELSFLSRSPTPPSDFGMSYPTPIASEVPSLKSTPAPEPLPSKKRPAPTRDDDPPAKKRRVSQKPRTTERLDLTADQIDEGEKEQLDKLLKALYKKRKIVVIAGAGISVSAGIPDFRSATGLFKSLKSQHNLKSSGQDLFDASVYKDDDSTSTFHDMVRNLAKATKEAKPTPFHHLLATLAAEGRLLRLYSQNVDGIDTGLEPLATQIPLPKKGPWPKTIQLHGGLDKMVCTKCHQVFPFQPDLFEGPVPPACMNCMETDDVRTKYAGKRSHGVGRLRPRMVLYNEHNPDDEAIGSVAKADLRTRPDALIVVGTTLKVPGIKRITKEMCAIVRDRRDGVTVWINNDPPPPSKDFEWDLVVRGPCDAVASQAAMRRWNEKFEEVTDEQLQKAREESKGFEVIVPTSPKKASLPAQEPTPSASPQLTPITVIGKTTSDTTKAIAMKLQNPATKTKAARKPRAPKAKDTKPQPAKPAVTTKKRAPPKKKAAAAMAKGASNKLNFRISKTAPEGTTSKSGAIDVKPIPAHKLISDEVGAENARDAAKTREMNSMAQDQLLREVAAQTSASLTDLCKNFEDSTSTSDVEGTSDGNVDSQGRTPFRPESPIERARIIAPPGPVSESLRLILN
ncbi:DHS-like NAD/FAD-binding domain-containing protein [Trichodelitschia bisporula]|uniref:DHS-like NAD/FAD-binding domain-containing protein n=1 Tax=Trichodelitschia bisporula TaxID=703511 RepID=A0A6G1HYW6_9PEZI|nr:DHS-like NAD/FAD-binding domain-containing protein [Trichodelitschia bisporula]